MRFDDVSEVFLSDGGRLELGPGGEDRDFEHDGRVRREVANLAEGGHVSVWEGSRKTEEESDQSLTRGREEKKEKNGP